MKKKLFSLLLITILLGMAAGCASSTVTPTGTPAPNGQITVPAVSVQIYAPGPNPLVHIADSQGKIAGVLLGIWHGVISPVTMVLMFFNTGAQMYEVHNDGSQYNLGFLLGVAIVFVLLGGFVGSRRR